MTDATLVCQIDRESTEPIKSCLYIYINFENNHSQKLNNVSCFDPDFPILQFRQDMVDTLYRYAKFQYECGNYSGAAEYLYFVRVLVSGHFLSRNNLEIFRRGSLTDHLLSVSTDTLLIACDVCWPAVGAL